MAQIRRLTPAGVSAAREFLAGVRAAPRRSFNVPNSILLGARTSQEIPGAPEVQPRTFPTRRVAAVSLDASFASFDSRVVDDAGMWSWLGMYYFAYTVRVANGEARLSPRDEAFVINGDDPRSLQRRYVHFLWSAWRLYRQHGEDAAFLLDRPLHDQGDIADRVLSNARVFNSVGVVPLILRLYTHTGRQKTGFGHGSGGLRHLMRVLNQRERTHDVYAMTPDELIQILPPEFERWNELPLGAS